MASPLKAGKQSVDLASGEVRVSRIRRDPPPKLKEIAVRDRNGGDRWAAAIGILAFALAILVLIIAFGSYSDRSLRDYTVEL